MATLTLFSWAVVLLALGAPIAFVLGVPSIPFLLFKGHRLSIIPNQMFEGIESFVLVAIPLFFLVGDTMNRAGISERLIKFVNMFVGGFKGGLAHANTVTSVLFAGMTGTGTGDVAAVGSVFIPAMKKEGYDVQFSAAVTAASAVVGPIIPPSVIMVIYGSIIGVSIGGLFAAGFVPGVLIGLACMAINYIQAVRRHYPHKKVKYSLKEYFLNTLNAIPPLLTPIIILGGMLSGQYTPTEAAAVAVAYAFFLGFCYRKLNLKTVYAIFVESAIKSSVILLIIATSTILSRIFAVIGLTSSLIDLMKSLTTDPNLSLLMILFFILIMGCFLDLSVIVILFGPILAPLAVSMGFQPLHFGITMIVAVNIGMITPPMGTCLFASCAISGISLEEISREIWPYVIVETAVLFLIAYWEWLALWVPRLLGFS